MVEHRVFINYRGEDSRSYAALLYEGLSRHLGADRVFLDSESIPAGADAVEVLLREVRRCTVLLAVIGPRWLSAADAASRRRIDDPDDWVRRELADALASGLTVIPVLTDDGVLPKESDLPADIAAMGRRQYRRLRHREASSDVARLVADLTADGPAIGSGSRDSQPRRTLGIRAGVSHPGGAANRSGGPAGSSSRRRRTAILALVALVAVAVVAVVYPPGRWVLDHSSPGGSRGGAADSPSRSADGPADTSQPAISVTPDHGSPTDLFTVRGTGWIDVSPCGQVNIWVDGRILSHQRGLPGANGRFTVTFDPRDAGPSDGTLGHGPHKVTARCNSYESAAANYTVDT